MMNEFGKKEKLKRRCISMKEKISILDRLKSGEKLKVISKELQLNESTLRTIRNNETKIRTSVGIRSLPILRKTARIKDPIISKMENCLMVWVDDCNHKSIPLNNHLIKQKAIKIYTHLKQHIPSDEIHNYDFKGSQGWFDRFRKRFSLHNIKVQGERASADLESAQKFKEEFRKFLEEGGYTADQVFNADETGLFWKKMPQRTFISKNEKSAPGFKAAKERITLLLCSNASGNYLMKPLLINKSLNPRAMKGCDKSTFPIYWQANKKAWVTAAIFREWFFNCFVPDVENYLKEKNLGFKALLIIDNAPGHPTDLYHPNINLKFLPPNTTSIIQPLDQGIIKTLKSYYMRRTFEEILAKQDSNPCQTITQIWKDFSILNCVENIGLSIKELKQSTLNACWKNIWPEIVNAKNQLSSTSIDIDGIITAANLLGGEGFDDMNREDISELINSEESLNESELMELVDEYDLTINSHQESLISEETSTNFTSEHLNKGLELAKQLEVYFTSKDSLMERSMQFKRDFQECLAPYFKLQAEYEANNDKLLKSNVSPNKTTQKDIFNSEVNNPVEYESINCREIQKENKQPLPVNRRRWNVILDDNDSD